MARIDWKSIIGSVAPNIATALGGPLAGTAVNAVSQAVLGKPNGTQAEIADVLAKQNNPEVLAKLKEAELQYAAKMKELGVDLERIAVKDRIGARLREVALKDFTPKLLAILYTVGYFTILYFLWEHGIPKFDDPTYNVKDLINTLLGVLSAAQMAIIAYYFGSSASSAQKSELMERQAKK